MSCFRPRDCFPAFFPTRRPCRSRHFFAPSRFERCTATSNDSGEMHEDQAFLSRLMLQRSVVVIDEVLHLYRQHETSCVARTHHEGRDLQARRQFLEWLETELEPTPTTNEEIRAVVRAEKSRTRGWLRRRIRRALINFLGRPSVA